MAQLITFPSLSGYEGLTSLYEYVNADGALWRYNCGQAAAATLLSHLDPARRDQPLLAWLEKEHGPDNLGGWLGTSRRRVERALRAVHWRPRAVRGENALRQSLAAQRPVILSVQLSLGKFWKWDIPSAHWMLAFGFDSEYVYLSNWWDNRMKWEDFRAGWAGWVPALTNMRLTALTVDR